MSGGHNLKRWQLVMHCHLRPLVPTSVVFDFNYVSYEAQNAPAYHIFAHRAIMLELFGLVIQQIFTARFQGSEIVAPFFADGGPNYTKFSELGSKIEPKFCIVFDPCKI